MAGLPGSSYAQGAFTSQKDKSTSQGSGFPMQMPWSLTTPRAGLDPVSGRINHSSDPPEPWPLLSASLSPRLTCTIPQELKLITDFRLKGSKCCLFIALFLRATKGKHLLLLSLVPLRVAVSA